MFQKVKMYECHIVETPIPRVWRIIWITPLRWNAAEDKRHYRSLLQNFWWDLISSWTSEGKRKKHQQQHQHQQQQQQEKKFSKFLSYSLNWIFLYRARLYVALAIQIFSTILHKIIDPHPPRPCHHIWANKWITVAVRKLYQEQVKS